jgi:hypothetical protein
MDINNIELNPGIVLEKCIKNISSDILTSMQILNEN